MEAQKKVDENVLDIDTYLSTSKKKAITIKGKNFVVKTVNEFSLKEIEKFQVLFSDMEKAKNMSSQETLKIVKEFIPSITDEIAMDLTIGAVTKILEFCGLGELKKIR